MYTLPVWSLRLPLTYGDFCHQVSNDAAADDVTVCSATTTTTTTDDDGHAHGRNHARLPRVVHGYHASVL